MHRGGKNAVRNALPMAFPSGLWTVTPDPAWIVQMAEALAAVSLLSRTTLKRSIWMQSAMATLQQQLTLKRL